MHVRDGFTTAFIKKASTSPAHSNSIVDLLFGLLMVTHIDQLIESDDMKQAIKTLLDLVRGMTAADAFQAVDQYYQRVCSLESDEWNNRMSQQEKKGLIAALLTRNSQ